MSVQQPPVGRVRRARKPVARDVVHKVKLTAAERDQLLAKAADLGVSVPRLLAESSLLPSMTVLVVNIWGRGGIDVVKVSPRFRI